MEQAVRPVAIGDVDGEGQGEEKEEEEEEMRGEEPLEVDFDGDQRRGGGMKS